MPSSWRGKSAPWTPATEQRGVQLILVSGLSGAGKSIALDVLEDGGYYCVDNLPATLLMDVVGFLSAAGHERVAVSVDARSAALAALPESVARLKSGGADCRVLFLEANPQTLMRRFSETRRRHPLTVEGLTLAEAIARERVDDARHRQCHAAEVSEHRDHRAHQQERSCPTADRCAGGVGQR